MRHWDWKFLELVLFCELTNRELGKLEGFVVSQFFILEWINLIEIALGFFEFLELKWTNTVKIKLQV